LIAAHGGVIPCRESHAWFYANTSDIQATAAKTVSISSPPQRSRESLEMAKLGRKPVPGDRYESGRIKPHGGRNDGPPPMQVKRLLDECLRAAMDPRLGTGLGRLLAYGEIKAHQFAAAEAYAKLRGRFDRATGVPCRTAQSPCYGDARSSGGGQEPLSDKAYQALVDDHRRLLAEVGRWFPMLERVCVDDGYLAEDERRSLPAVLDMLAIRFGMARAA
jgi:hypothetical protein